MIVLEIALAILLIWLLACCSLILGGSISVCALRLSRARDDDAPLLVRYGGGGGYYAFAHHQQKSERYLD